MKLAIRFSRDNSVGINHETHKMMKLEQDHRERTSLTRRHFVAQFAGAAPEANKFLKRTYRAPWTIPDSV